MGEIPLPRAGLLHGSLALERCLCPTWCLQQVAKVFSKQGEFNILDCREIIVWFLVRHLIRIKYRQPIRDQGAVLGEIPLPRTDLLHGPRRLKGAFLLVQAEAAARMIGTIRVFGAALRCGAVSLATNFGSRLAGVLRVLAVLCGHSCHQRRCVLRASSFLIPQTNL